MERHASRAVGSTGSEEDERVPDVAGETVGRVVAVRRGTAAVDPAPDLVDADTSVLGRGDVDEETSPLGRERVAPATDDDLSPSGSDPTVRADR